MNSALVYALNIAGATEIYKAGGAQAIAAMAFGTNSIRRVQKVFGPGNAYVVAAKRMLVGHVAIDLLPGPSEVLVLADETADAAFAAADLLARHLLAIPRLAHQLYVDLTRLAVVVLLRHQLAVLLVVQHQALVVQLQALFAQPHY